MTPGALILAAGSSRRFGGDKRKSEFAPGKTLLQATIELVSALFNDVLVVLRADDQDYANEITVKYPGIVCYCAPESAQGMGHSLGNASTQISEWQAAAVFLADMPFVAPSTIKALTDTYLVHQADQPIVMPTYADQRGHPVIFDRAYFSELASLNGDNGARTVVSAHKENVILTSVNDPGVLKDIDRPDDFR